MSQPIFSALVTLGADPDEIVDILGECGAIDEIIHNRGPLELMGVSPLKLTDEAIDDWY